MRSRFFVGSAAALKVGLVMVVTALSVAGCIAETAEHEPFEAAAEPGAAPPSGEESVASLQEELVACNKSQWHGGDLFPKTFDAVLGCNSCGAGRVRTRYTVWNEGHGNCEPIGWATSDPRDCQVRVRIHQSGGFANGTCRVLVEAEDVACPHTKCTTGARLHRACPDPCIARICAVDPYCCDTAWDAICVREVATVCGQSC